MRSESWPDRCYLTLLLLVITDEPYLRATRDMRKNRLKSGVPNQSPNKPEDTIPSWVILAEGNERKLRTKAERKRPSNEFPFDQ